MKKTFHLRLFMFLCLLNSLPHNLIAGNYTVGVGRTITINCTATPPAGYITHSWWSVVNEADNAYVGFNYNTSDLSCTVYGLSAKTNIKVEVTYAYSYMGSYDNNLHVGHGTYYDYITVTGGVEPTSVSIDQGSDIRMAVGETITVSASLLPRNASTAFEWGTVTGFSEPYKFDITYIGNKCYITAKRAGYIQLVCQTGNGLVAVSKVTAEDVEPSAVSLPSSMTVYMGEKSTIKPTLEPKNAATQYTWQISNDIVEIKGNEITPKQIGETTILCTTSNSLQSNTCRLIVEYREAKDIVMEFDTIIMAEESSIPINYRISPLNAIQEAVLSIVKGGDIIRINNDSSITAIKEGEAILLATANNGLSAACVVIVKPKLRKVELPENITLLYGEQYTLQPVFVPQDAYFMEYSWVIDNEGIAVINNDNILAKSVGRTKISLLVDGYVRAEIDAYVKAMSFLNVWTIDGMCIRTPLQERPSLTYSQDDSILVKTNDRECYFAIKDIVKITLADENEIVENTSTTTGWDTPIDKIDIHPSDEGMDFYNLPANTVVRIYTVSGLLIQTYLLTGSKFTMDRNSLNKGIYIVEINNMIFKIIQQ